MKILVTGGLGFIGSNFILKLLRNSDEYHITNVDAELYGSNIKNVSEIKDSLNYEFVKGNITNKRLMEELISKCDAVINFAAESFVDRSIVDPNSFLVSNIRGTFTILDIITKQKKRLVQISTDEVFGSLKSGTADEKSVFNPSSPYAATKASAELLINSYVKTYNSDVVITRCTNNYGPRQYAEKLIPKTIILAKQNKKIPIYGKGTNIRDWIYVDDHCNAIMTIMEKGKFGQSYNIAGKNEINNNTNNDNNTSLCPEGQVVVNRTELDNMIANNEDYSNVCTAYITDMSNLFIDKSVNYDISQWDTSNVTDMTYLFKGSDFNQFISQSNI